MVCWPCDPDLLADVARRIRVHRIVRRRAPGRVLEEQAYTADQEPGGESDEHHAAQASDPAHAAPGNEPARDLGNHRHCGHPGQDTQRHPNHQHWCCPGSGAIHRVGGQSGTNREPIYDPERIKRRHQEASDIAPSARRRWINAIDGMFVERRFDAAVPNECHHACTEQEEDDADVFVLGEAGKPEHNGECINGIRSERTKAHHPAMDKSIADASSDDLDINRADWRGQNYAHCGTVERNAQRLQDGHDWRVLTGMGDGSTQRGSALAVIIVANLAIRIRSTYRH